MSLNELELSADSAIQFTGAVKMHLPSYMTMLDIDEMKDVQRSPVRMHRRLGIAVGLEPKSHDIVLVTAEGCFYELNAVEHKLPLEKCILIDSGQTIQFPCVSGVTTNVYEVSVDWFVQNAKRMLVKINLFTS